MTSISDIRMVIQLFTLHKMKGTKHVSRRWKQPLYYTREIMNRQRHPHHLQISSSYIILYIHEYKVSTDILTCLYKLIRKKM